MFQKQVSCGIIYSVKGTNKILVEHVTLSKDWSIPKGCAEPNENYDDAAVRELFEETGIKLDKNKLVLIGKFDYLPLKDLVLYYYEASVDEAKHAIDNAKCTSTFEHEYKLKNGAIRIVNLPEVDKFKFIDVSEINDYVNEMLARILNNVLNSLYRR